MKKSKRLYILRHGQAESYQVDSDEQRQLTEFGIAQVKKIAQEFKAKGEGLDAIFVSPYVRAQQTSAIFIEEFGDVAKRENSSLIRPYGQCMDVSSWLYEQPYDAILLVTHQPFAYDLIDFLSDAPLPMNFSMSTATLAALEGDILSGACCQFRWFVSP